MTETRIETQTRIERHNANVVGDVAEAGGCGLRNLQHGTTCGLAFGHSGPCDFLPPEDVPEALAAEGIDLEASQPI
jgi:hypothetical protein